MANTHSINKCYCYISSCSYLRVEVLIAVKMSMVVVWVVTHVDLQVGTNVSEEYIASSSALELEAVCSSEILVLTSVHGVKTQKTAIDRWSYKQCGVL
jgi:hypothetical protein